MSDLISRDEAMDIFAIDFTKKDRQMSYHGFCTAALVAISSLPSAEKTGKWIFNPHDGVEAMFTKPKCSICGFESADGLNYCSNCGSKMDLGE